MQGKTGVDTTRGAIQEFNQGIQKVGAGKMYPYKLFPMVQNALA